MDSKPTTPSHPMPSHDGTSEDLLSVVVAEATDIMAQAKAAASRKRQGKQQVDQPMSLAEFELLPTSSKGPTGKRMRSGTAFDVRMSAAPAPAASSAHGKQASSSQQPMEASGRRRSSIPASRHSAPAASGRAGGRQLFSSSTPAQHSYNSTASDEQQLGSMQQHRSSSIPLTQPIQLNIHLMPAASVGQVRMPAPVAATASPPTGSIPLHAKHAPWAKQAAQTKQAAQDSSRLAAEMAPAASHPDLLSVQQSYNTRASSATTNSSFHQASAGFQRSTPTFLAAASSLPDVNIIQQVFQQQQHAGYGQAPPDMMPPAEQPSAASAGGSPGYTYKLQYQQMYMQQYQQQLQIKHGEEQALGDAQMQHIRQQESMHAHPAGIPAQQEQQHHHEEVHLQQAVQAQYSMQQQAEMMPKQGHSSTERPEDSVEDLRQGVDCPLKMPGEII
jgi:hypothetical protein